MAAPYGYIYLRRDTSVPSRYKIGQTTQPEIRDRAVDAKGTELLMLLPVWGDKYILDSYEADIKQNFAMKYQVEPGKREWFRGDGETMVTDMVQHRTSMHRLMPATPRPAQVTNTDTTRYHELTEDKRRAVPSLKGTPVDVRTFIELLLFLDPVTGKLYWYNHQQNNSFYTHVTVSALLDMYNRLRTPIQRPINHVDITLEQFKHMLYTQVVYNTRQYLSDGSEPYKYYLYLANDNTDGTISTSSPSDIAAPLPSFSATHGWVTPPPQDLLPSKRTAGAHKSKRQWLLPAVMQRVIPSQYRHMVSVILVNNMLQWWYGNDGNKITYMTIKPSPYLTYNASTVPTPVAMPYYVNYITLNNIAYYTGSTIGISDDYVILTHMVNGGLPIFMRSTLQPTGLYVVADNRNHPIPITQNVIAYQIV